MILKFNRVSWLVVVVKNKLKTILCFSRIDHIHSPFRPWLRSPCCTTIICIATLTAYWWWPSKKGFRSKRWFFLIENQLIARGVFLRNIPAVSFCYDPGLKVLTLLNFTCIILLTSLSNSKKFSFSLPLFHKANVLKKAISHIKSFLYLHLDRDMF